jgi:glycosidase
VNPLLLELNTRCWLRELSDREGRAITLECVPDREFNDWQRLGFTHIWLMGAWPTGPRARQQALESPDLRARYDVILPDWTPADVAGSPYAVAAYHVPEALGGEAGLSVFRHRLHQRGLKLVLDFVPNHVGLDHPWLRERPGLFVQSAEPREETFAQSTNVGGELQIAHGRDPYFAPWLDTAQMDYRLPATRRAMIELLGSVARRCDGVRCDMAMLVLNDVFHRTWAEFSVPEQPAPEEFWPEAIRAVRSTRPDFLFLAEAYWGLEPRLIELGFDFAYDKTFYDHLVRDEPAALMQHLCGAASAWLGRGARFLENHDEPRAADVWPLERHRAAALLLLALPGLRLIHDGQLTGARIHTPVHLSRRAVESANGPVAAFYARLLEALRWTAAGRGRWKLLMPQPSEAAGLIAIQWTGGAGDCDLAVVNPGAQPWRGNLHLELPVRGASRPAVESVFQCVEAPPPVFELHGHRLSLEVAPGDGCLLRVR